MSPHLVLVGLMGTGKSTVARQLANRLQRPAVDTDHLVEQRTGRTVREIFETDGEEAFRDVEESVLADALSDARPSVVAAAGGSILRESNRRLMRDCELVVWLDASVDLLVHRTRHRGPGGHRPLLDSDPRTRLASLKTERESLYREVADERIEVDGLSVVEVVDLAARLHSAAIGTARPS